MSQPKVVITDYLEEASVEIPVLADIAEVDLARARSEAELATHLEQAQVLIVYHDIPMLTDETFSRADQCRGVVRAGVGFNNIDREAAGRRGIVVCNVPDYGTEEVADHTIMLLLATVRGLVACDSAMRRGEWDLHGIRQATRLRGRTLGIVGCGRIGTATALRAKAFGLDVVFHDPYVPAGLEKALGIRRAASLPELLRQSHFVSLHCFLDPSTLHLINAEAFQHMRSGAILINTARGPVVDQKALIEALDSGHLAAAALDVFEREPLDDEHLRNHPRVILSPHVAFYSIEGYEEMRRKSAEEARRLLLGEPPRNPVNLSILEHPRTSVGRGH
jgi:phosphoglycerate dehydrogenase-like enzyme